MRFANFLNEAYSKELSNALRKRGLAKKVGDLAADWNISITRSETHDVSDYYVGNSTKPIKNVIADIRRDPYDIRNYGDGILLFVHTTDGITCCRINSRDIPSSRDLDRYTKIGDVSGEVESCYFIKTGHEDRSSWSDNTTSELRRNRSNNKIDTDSTTAMAQERKHKMNDINIGRSISKNKLTNKIQTLLEDFNIVSSDINAGSIFVTQRQLGNKTVYRLHNLNTTIECTLENRFDIYSSDAFDGYEEDCLDHEAKIEFSVIAGSRLGSFETKSDNLSDHLEAHETYVQLIKTLTKIRELLKGKTWRDLLVN